MVVIINNNNAVMITGMLIITIIVIAMRITKEMAASALIIKSIARFKTLAIGSNVFQKPYRII